MSGAGDQQSADSNVDPPGEISPSNPLDERFLITIRLGSERKAEVNDPKPPLDSEELLKGRERFIAEGSTTAEGLLHVPCIQRDRDEKCNEHDTESGDDNREDAALGDFYLDEDENGNNYSEGDEEHTWLENMYISAVPVANSEAQPATTSDIGACVARLVRREQMRASFWLEMEEPAQETSDLAFDLFDRYGRLQSDWYRHEVRKGTGVWGEELNRGDLLLFEHISVNQEWRRQGLASKMINAVLEKTRSKVADGVGFFALVSPGFLRRELETSEVPANEMIAIAQTFFQSHGFRRVGTSDWYARAENAEHPSRHIESGQDWQNTVDKGNHVVQEHGKSLHRILTDMTLTETECINKVRAMFSSLTASQRCSFIDRDGNNVLHAAALSMRPELIKTIMNEAPATVAQRRDDGRTPYEALQRAMEVYRTRREYDTVTVVVSDDFAGFAAPATDSLAVLQPDVSTTQQTTLKLKYGCTCGNCLDGFLSPRMHFALTCAAEVNHDILNDDLIGASGDEWLMNSNQLLIHLPVTVRQNLGTNKSMRQGFINMFGHIAECLRRKLVPTERNVLAVFTEHVSEWPPVTKNYLGRGGSVASVVLAVFEAAMSEDECTGNGYTMKYFSDEINNLPACRNDHEFGFVSGMCGYKRLKPGGSEYEDACKRGILGML